MGPVIYRNFSPFTARTSTPNLVRRSESSVSSLTKEDIDLILDSPYETNYTYSDTVAYKPHIGSREYIHPRLCRRFRFTEHKTVWTRLVVQKLLRTINYSFVSSTAIFTRAITFFYRFIFSILTIWIFWARTVHQRLTQIIHYTFSSSTFILHYFYEKVTSLRSRFTSTVLTISRPVEERLPEFIKSTFVSSSTALRIFYKSFTAICSQIVITALLITIFLARLGVRSFSAIVKFVFASTIAFLRFSYSKVTTFCIGLARIGAGSIQTLWNRTISMLVEITEFLFVLPAAFFRTIFSTQTKFLFSGCIFILAIVLFFEQSSHVQIEKFDERTLLRTVRRMIRTEIRKYDADRTGMPDYALESSGGSVLSTRCTVQFNERSRVQKIFGIPLWYSSYSPRTVIQRKGYGASAGECWAFYGGHGFLTIGLSKRINVTAISYEHLPVELSPDGHIRTAPKNFLVWSYQNVDDVGSRFLLGNFTYFNEGEPLQIFLVQQWDPRLTQIIELETLSNWGSYLTCLYRFRVHGDSLDIIPDVDEENSDETDFLEEGKLNISKAFGEEEDIV